MRCVTLAGDPTRGHETMVMAAHSLALLYRMSYDEMYEYYQDFGGGLLFPSSAAIRSWLGNSRAP